MAHVYDGHRIGPRGFRKPVAIKVLRDEGPAYRAALLREARLAASVRHPNVVDVLDVGEFEGMPFFVMERVEGQTVKALLAAESLPAPDALDLLLQVASGLAALHDAGIVHRDVKPANVLVDHAGRVRVVDLGISETAGSRERARWGTLNYMSPEQAAGEFVGVGGDVFAFGALMAEVLCGQRLWTLSSLEEALRALNDPGPRLAQVRPAVDAALPGAGDVLARCLRSHPGRRFPDGHHLWKALDALGDTRGSRLADRSAPKPATEAASVQKPPLDAPAWAGLVQALTVFRGGFALEDAVSVLEGAGLVAPWLGITQLVDAGTIERRRDRLFMTGTERSLSPLPGPVRQAHAEHYAQLGTDERVGWLLGPRAAELQARWLDEQHNLLAALKWSLDKRHPDAWKLARALHHVQLLGGTVDGLDALTSGIDEPRTLLAKARAWSTSGRQKAGGRVLDRLLLRPDLDPATHAMARVHRARIYLGVGDLEASREHADKAVELSDRHGLRAIQVRAMRVHAVLLRRRSRYGEALRLLVWCRQVCRALADHSYLARIEALTGLLHMDQGENHLALNRIEGAVAALRATPNALELASQLGNLALVQRRLGLARPGAREPDRSPGPVRAERPAGGGHARLLDPGDHPRPVGLGGRSGTRPGTRPASGSGRGPLVPTGCPERHGPRPNSPWPLRGRRPAAR
jgi:tetratricopeptide (TPR) repeat protein